MSKVRVNEQRAASPTGQSWDIVCANMQTLLCALPKTSVEPAQGSLQREPGLPGALQVLCFCFWEGSKWNHPFKAKRELAGLRAAKQYRLSSKSKSAFPTYCLVAILSGLMKEDTLKEQPYGCGSTKTAGVMQVLVLFPVLPRCQVEYHFWSHHFILSALVGGFLQHL